VIAGEAAARERRPGQRRRDVEQVLDPPGNSRSGLLHPVEDLPLSSEVAVGGGALGVLVTVLSRAATRERDAMCGLRIVLRFHVAAVARRYW